MSISKEQSAHLARMNATFDEVAEIATRLGHGKAVLRGGAFDRRVELVLDPIGARYLDELLKRAGIAGLDSKWHLAEHNPKIRALVQFIEDETCVHGALRLAGHRHHGNLVVIRGADGTSVELDGTTAGEGARLRVDVIESLEVWLPEWDQPERPAMDVLNERGYFKFI